MFHLFLWLDRPVVGTVVGYGLLASRRLMGVLDHLRGQP